MVFWSDHDAGGEIDEAEYPIPPGGPARHHASLVGEVDPH